MPVTGANRYEFITRYAHYLLNTVVDVQFSAFLSGFRKVRI